MKNILSSSKGAPLILIAPATPEPVTIARYQDVAGETILGNAGFLPHAITDGKQMQAIGAEQQTLTPREVGRLLSIGQCRSCSSKLLATASAVDAMESAGTDIHCPMCSASVTPVIDYVELTNALAAEFAGEDDEDADDDADDADDSTDTYDDMDPDGADDDGDEERADGGDDDDADADDDSDEDDDDADEDDDSDDSDDDDDDEDGDDDAFDDDADDDESDDADDEVEQAAIALRPLVAAATRRARPRVMATADELDPMNDAVDPDEDVDYQASPLAPVDADSSIDAMDDDMDPDGDVDFDEAVAALARDVRRMDRRGTLARTVRAKNVKKVREMAGDDEDQDDEEMASTGEVAAARRAVRDATRALDRAVADDEVERTKALNRDKIGGRRPTEVETPAVEVSPSLDSHRDDGDDDDDMNTIGVGEPGARPRRKMPSTASASGAIARARNQLVLANLQLECALDAQRQPIAGAPRKHEGVARMNEESRARLRKARGMRIDGNAKIKSRMAKAAMGDDDMMVDPLGLEGDDLNGTFQPETPGTTDPTPPTGMRPDVDAPTPGTRFTENLDDELALSALRVIDWPTARVQVMATAGGAQWVFANDRPVGTLNRENASDGVAATWGTPVMEKAFLSACARGLSVEEAREFGMRVHRLRIDGSEAVRSTIRSAHRMAQERASGEIDASAERFRQSVKTAFLGSMKGAWPGMRNPMRDRLVASLAALGQAEPRAIVDTALAASVEPMLQAVFEKATELAAKPDVARNELAQFVAEAAYQGRVDEATVLADRLAAGNGAASRVAAAPRPQREVAADDAPKTTAERMTRHLQRIAHRG